MNKVRLINACRAFCAWLIVFAQLILAPASWAAESITYYHWDALGSPVAATDEQGNLKWREQYAPYGERLQNETTSQTNTRWYTGHPTDSATGLTYMGARWYDPVVGRFYAVDPKGPAEGNLNTFNRYAYGNNNPYTFVDPNGEEAVELNLFFIGGTIGQDAGSGQPFWKFRLGLTGLGLMFYPSYDYSPVDIDDKVGDCMACDTRASSSGKNIALGASAGIGFVSLEGNIIESPTQYVNVEKSSGKIVSGVYDPPIKWFEGHGKLGWSGKGEPVGNSRKARIGVKVNMDANAEWGGLIPWSEVNSNNVKSLRDPNF